MLHQVGGSTRGTVMLALVVSLTGSWPCFSQGVEMGAESKGSNASGCGAEAEGICPDRKVPVRFSDVTRDTATFDVTGKWYAVNRCASMSGRYLYTMRQSRSGRIEGRSAGVSFGARGISGVIYVGEIVGGEVIFEEAVSDGFVARFAGTITAGGDAIDGRYVTSRRNRNCAFRMTRQIDTRPNSIRGVGLQVK